MESEILIKALSSEALGYPVKAKEVKVISQASLNAANDFLLGVKHLLAKIAETFDPVIKQAHEAHKTAIEQKKKHEEPLLQAERIIKAEIGHYLSEQERIRREAEEKARREAEKAERERLRKMQEAIEAENAGKEEEAEQKFEEAMAVEPPRPIVPPVPKAEGTFLRRELRWRIVNEAAIPREFLMPDKSKIELAFRTRREKLAILGIEIYEDTTVVSRSS